MKFRPGSLLVKVKPDAESCTEREPVFADLLLIAGLFQLLEIIVFAVGIAIVAKPPLRIDVDIVSQATKDADLYKADVNRVPDEPCSGLHVEATPAQRQGRNIILCRQLFIGGGQLSVECNDVGMISQCAADQYQQAPRLHHGGVSAG